jgi:hypothetical protein
MSSSTSSLAKSFYSFHCTFLEELSSAGFPPRQVEVVGPAAGPAVESLVVGTHLYLFCVLHNMAPQAQLIIQF